MSSKDKNQYSLEDMVRSAKTTEQNKKRRGEREVIHNDDGTKTVRVRKRKKSSGSSASKQVVDDLLGNSKDNDSFKSILLISLICILLVFVFGGYGVLNLLKYNKPGHQQKVQEVVSEQFGGTVKMSDIKFGINKFTASEVNISESDSFFQNLDLKKLKTEYNPSVILYGDISSDQLRAESGSAIINEASLIKRNRAPLELPIQFKNFASDEFEISFGNEQQTVLKQSSFRFRNSSNTTESKQISVRSGEIENLNALPKYLKRSSFNIEGGIVDVGAVLGNKGEVGELEISGEIDLAFQEKHDLSLSVTALNLEDLYRPLTNLFEGRVSSRSGKFTLFPQTKKYQYETELSAVTSGISIKGFQFLDHIGLYLEDLDYSYIIFRDNTELNWNYKNKVIQLTDIDFEKKSYLAVSGDLSINTSDNSLKGKLKIGIPTGKVLRELKNVNVDNFETRRGYLWVKTSVRGTIDAPIDDFKEQFELLR